MSHIKAFISLLFLVAILVTCGNNSSINSATNDPISQVNPILNQEPEESTIWDILRPDQTDQTVSVNRYIWNAAVEVLDFLPIKSIDPFTGIISTDYGTPPGGGKAYRATVHITDPALDARALRVSLVTRSGPVAAETSRAVEDAILSRARQLRIADSRF
ncbi:MAG: DUF3576 domain-containing protein [Aestuariivita sp.]|nr:DUF3576 domain-containing protein [Aestuariivita sp.]